MKCRSIVENLIFLDMRYYIYGGLYIDADSEALLHLDNFLLKNDFETKQLVFPFVESNELSSDIIPKILNMFLLLNEYLCYKLSIF